MSNSLTHEGQLLSLGCVQDAAIVTGGGTHSGSKSLGNIPGLILAITKIKLFGDVGTRRKAKSGAGSDWGITEIPTGSGYSTGGKTISMANWTADVTNFGANANISLADQTWTATGTFPASGSAGVLGAFLTDASDNVIAWWERTAAVTLASSDKVIADSLQIVII